MKTILLLCSSLLMAHNNFLTTCDQPVGMIKNLVTDADAYALSCTINLTGCKKHELNKHFVKVKKLVKHFLPSILNTTQFKNIHCGDLGQGFKACIFNEDATITIHVKEDNIYVEVTNSSPFNPYLISAYLANFYEAEYFSCTTILR